MVEICDFEFMFRYMSFCALSFHVREYLSEFLSISIEIIIYRHHFLLTEKSYGSDMKRFRQSFNGI